MTFIALLAHGPKWVEGVPLSKQGPEIKLHLDAMGAWYDSGKVSFGGPFHSESGGVAIIDAETASEAMAMMDADPAVKAGLLSYSLERLVVMFDRATNTFKGAPRRS